MHGVATRRSAPSALVAVIPLTKDVFAERTSVLHVGAQVFCPGTGALGLHESLECITAAMVVDKAIVGAVRAVVRTVEARGRTVIATHDGGCR